ncbi:MAG: TRAP transporter small permease subunit [Desulfarculaceae bacterium]|nr:TRAP transporter small permease subunit [Desulfarculaceae bacterium]MCF8071182.1 TRAP transporter small permease subunit [Desulfarculaceae bacterium]MCF8101215.1 TRAP transporter small permease subunit [Desulfarculaceae bacterium]MCF8115236.1 TRAP transporter small permease subunit [Desulfarculaceae bacterium]
MKVLGAIDRLSELSGKVFSFAFLAASVVVVYAVIMRYLFNQPTVWGLELTIYLCGATYLMSGGYAELNNSHIRIDSIYNKFPRKGQLLINILLTAPLVFLFCAVLIWYSWEWTMEALVNNEHSMTLWNPIIWPVRMLVPAGTLVLLLQCIAQFIRDIREYLGR